MSVNWSKLTEEEKGPYNEQSNKDKVRYKQEIEKYNKDKKAAEKKAGKKAASEPKKKESAPKKTSKKDKTSLMP